MKETLDKLVEYIIEENTELKRINRGLHERLTRAEAYIQALKEKYEVQE